MEPRLPTKIVFNLLRIPPDGELELAGEISGDVLDLDRDPVARADGPVSYALIARFAGESVLVRGSASAPVKLLCSRCARFFSTSVRISAFLRAYPRQADADSLDVTEDVREDLLCELPAYPACRNGDCKGLCARCGKDLNFGPCDCPPPPADDAWAALDGLVLPGEPNPGADP